MPKRSIDPPDMHAYMEALVGRDLETITGKINRIVSVQRGTVTVATERNVSGSKVSIKLVQKQVDRLYEGGWVVLDNNDRNAFVGAVLSTFEGIEFKLNPRRAKLFDVSFDTDQPGWEDSYRPTAKELLRPVLETTADLGGAAKNTELLRAVADSLDLSSDQLEAKLPGGGSNKFEFNLTWAKSALKAMGFLSNPTRGRWEITEEGSAASDASLEIGYLNYEAERPQRRAEFEKLRKTRIESEKVKQQRGRKAGRTRRSSATASPAGSHRQSDQIDLLEELLGLREPQPADTTTTVSGTSPELASARDRGGEVLPYSAWNTRPVPAPRKVKGAELDENLLEIVQAEGPLLADWLYSVHLNSCGRKTLGKKDKKCYNQSLGRLVGSDRLRRIRDGVEGFRYATFYSPDRDPVIVRELGPRGLNQVPRSEILQFSINKMLAASVGSEAWINEISVCYGLSGLGQSERSYLADCSDYEWTR